MHSFSRCSRCLATLPAVRPGDALPAECPFCQAPLEAAAQPLEAEARAREAARTSLHQQRELWQAEQRRERAALESGFQKELLAEGQLADRDTSQVVMVPRFDGRMAPLPEERAARFLARLEILARQAFSDDQSACYVPVESDDSPRSPPTTDELLFARVAQAACTLCRGYCCSHGGEHAFLDIDSLKQRSREQGWQAPEEIGAAYRAMLPAQSIADSCVFHSDTGCVLPRSLRSFTCNDFLCSGLDHLERTPPEPEVVEIAIISQHNGQRVGSAIVRRR